MAETPNMLTRLKKKMTGASIQSRKNSQHQMGRDKYMIFSGSEENFVRNGAWVLEESIALFHGKANPVRYLSIVDLNNMNVEPLPCYRDCNYNLYQGSWEGRVVLVKKSGRVDSHNAECLLREIVIAAQMVTHKNAHKILGCCLETESPVLVYEWMPSETLDHCIIVDDANQGKAVLEWKDRLRIAWEISHVVAYLNTAFPRPIIHKDLKPSNVFLDQNNAAKLGNFLLSISIPEGEEFVEDIQVTGTFSFIAPEYMANAKVSKSTDVYSFGVLLLVLLTGKRPSDKVFTNALYMNTWVLNCIKNNCVDEIVDPAITRNGVTSIEDLQQRAFAQLALRCITLETDYRPTMVEVATELKNMITSPEFIPTPTNFQYWIFHGSEEYFTQNRALIHKESISLFNDSVHPIRYFSVHDLNHMIVELEEVFPYCYRGTWERKAVLVKLSSYSDENQRSFLREIVVATQMATHNNVQNKLLGCCLETRLPVLVYEWVAAETLEDRIYRLPHLEWKDRLRIAWEISDVVSYLHTTFPMPIIHGSLGPNNVFLGQDNAVKLSIYNYSAPKADKGEDSMSWRPCRISCYLAPEYDHCRELGEYTDVYSFGMLFLVLLTGKDATRVEEYDELTNSADWITKKIRMGRITELIDPAIVTDGVAITELSASIELALRCTSRFRDCRPAMVDVATELNTILRSHASIPTTSTFQGAGMYMIFRGSKEYYMQNESFIAEESNSLFPGRMKPIRYFSVDELCKMKVKYHRIFWNEDCNWHQGSWEGNVVLVKLPERAASDGIRMRILREILVSTQMACHSYVQKLIGCCLETEYPVLVYESVAEETLDDRISFKYDNQTKPVLEWKDYESVAEETLEDWISFKYDNQTKPVLEWKERLRIAWEISHVVSHLHNDFSRPIIHGYLETDNIFLDLDDNTVKLSNFSRCISIPEGQNFVEKFRRDSDYKEPPEKDDGHVRVAECTDVYSFGILFLMLLTGETADWVYRYTCRYICLSDFEVDPAIAKNGVVTTEMAASIKLALRCITKRDKRPTMVHVANELEKIIRSSHLPNNSFSLLRGCLLN